MSTGIGHRGEDNSIRLARMNVPVFTKMWLGPGGDLAFDLACNLGQRSPLTLLEAYVGVIEARVEGSE